RRRQVAQHDPGGRQRPAEADRDDADGVVPQAGFADAGLLDLTKEFEPLGPVPRRGAAFYLRSDEAFGKPLSSVHVELDRLDTTAGGYRGAQYRSLQQHEMEQMAVQANHWFEVEGIDVTIDVGTLGGAAPAGPTIQWQHYVGGDWASVATKYVLESVTASVTAAAAPFSDPVPLGGDTGRAIRAFLFDGDFGWQDYLDTLASNAQLVASGQGASVVLAKPPDPPVFTRARIGYTTAQVASSASPSLVRLYARNGLSAALDVTGKTTVQPFVADPVGTATLYVGLDESVPLGETVSLYLDVDSATTCDAAEASATVTYEYDTGAGWKGLETADGTEALRQSGILRFVAQLDWAEGSATVDEAHGRWLRAHLTATSLPERVRRIQTDAVYARYVLAPGHETEDATPATPLAAFGVKGLVTAVPGIKKLTNPQPSWGGRGPEPDAAFAGRANGVVRHRNRAVTAWDVEELVRSTFPEVALVRCLPHHSEVSECDPGWVSVVVVPQSDDRTPTPSVQLAASIEELLVAHGPSGLSVAVLCPLYAEVSVQATVKLDRGAPGRDSHVAIETALRDFLHPLRTTRKAAGFGRSLFRSEIARFLESHPLVQYVEAAPELDFAAPYAHQDRIDVDACRGLIASAADQGLVVETTL
ncbi:MAG: baseplate J/gp47 family protein, partial [Gaiellaceae bacterium]